MKCLNTDLIQAIDCPVDPGATDVAAENTQDNYTKHSCYPSSGWCRAWAADGATATAAAGIYATSVTVTLKSVVSGVVVGSGLTLTDSNAHFVTDGVHAGNKVFFPGQAADMLKTVDTVDSETQLTLTSAMPSLTGADYAVEIASTSLLSTGTLVAPMGSTVPLTVGCSYTAPAGKGTGKKGHILLYEFGGSAPRCGIIRAGSVVSFPNPRYGIREGLIDYSLERPLSNGAIYIRRRENVRTFDGSVLVDRATDFYEFFQQIARNVGRTPLFWFLNDQATDYNWVVFARLSINGALSGVHGYVGLTEISFSLTEAI